MLPSEAAVAITAGLNWFHSTCVLRVALAARATVVKKSAASVGSSGFSSPFVMSPMTSRLLMSHSRSLLSRPVDATKRGSSAFHTKSSTPFECPAISASGQEVLLRRSHSFSKGDASESIAERHNQHKGETSQELQTVMGIPRHLTHAVGVVVKQLAPDSLLANIPHNHTTRSSARAHNVANLRIPGSTTHKTVSII